MENSFFVKGKPTKFCADPAHLVKSLSTALMKTWAYEHSTVNITMGDKFVQKWGLESNVINKEAIEALIEFQEKQESPLVVKLNQAVLKKATSRYVGKQAQKLIKPSLLYCI